VAAKIDNDQTISQMEVKKRAEFFRDEFGWSKDEALKIWAFAPDTYGPNVVVEQTQGVQYLGEIKDSIVSGFQWAAKEGPLAEEPLRACRFNMTDLHLHADAIHRGAGQLIPPMRSVVWASMLFAEPRLLEPIFAVEIQVPDDCLGKVNTVLNFRRGSVIEQTLRPGTSLFIVKASLPVKESFGFVEHLRRETSGKAFPSVAFSHYDLLPGNPYSEPNPKKEDETIQVIMAIRKDKGLKEKIPVYTDYSEKL